eukprot:TRINITY_DN64640_c0_g1_i1.p1 TRINITY_DN64640_c0_g1~~TRINITY_DN64640_c0_g1_i1.p1  ORF type:complete len:482 (+),score=38.93 TRINITY_DN64640_c0_g1_i1:696-2141(+)
MAKAWRLIAAHVVSVLAFACCVAWLTLNSRTSEVGHGVTGEAVPLGGACSCASELLLDRDCCQCTVSQVADATIAYFKPRLLELVQTPLFRTYAPYSDHPAQELYDVECSIPEFSELAQELSSLQLGCAIQQCGCSSEECKLERWRHEPCFVKCEEQENATKHKMAALSATQPVDSDETGPMRYNLLENPEQFTGYGTLLDDKSAAKIWESMYTDKICLTSCSDDTELEADPAKRLVYRVVSGLHASVNTHISMHYGFYDDSNEPATRDNWDNARNLRFAPWKDLFDHRVGQHEDRIRNMHFVFTLLTRALRQLGPHLDKLLDVGSKGCSACASQRQATQKLLQELVSPPADAPAECDAILQAFDTGALFPVNNASASELKADIMRRFRRMGELMTCVGCDRCKLWGSLQFHAARVALGILLDDGTDDDVGGDVDQFDVPRLSTIKPNDVVALVNALAQLSKSIDQVRQWTAPPSEIRTDL